MVKDPYEVLGVRRGADMDEIKRAYRRKAKANHPDLHPDDPQANARMQEINEAYDMLRDPDKYASRQHASPGADPFSGRAQQGGYTRQGPQYRQGSWQYTYYSNAGGQDAWRAWQNMWGSADAQRQEPPAAGILHPFRSILKVVGGLMLFRFIMALIRMLIFGFFR